MDFTLIFSFMAFYWHVDIKVQGLAAALYGLPGLLLGPVIGRLIDRKDPAASLAFSLLFRGLTALLLMLASNMWMFVAVIFFRGLANVGAMPAEQTLFRRLLTNDQLAENASNTNILDQVLKISAPLLAGLFALSNSPAIGFGLSVALGGLGAILAWNFRGQYKPNGSLGAKAREGGAMNELMSLLKISPTFRWAFAILLCQTLVLSLYDPMLAPFFRELGMPASVFGMVIGSTAIGSILAALAFRVMPDSWQEAAGAGALGAFGTSVLAAGVMALLFPSGSVVAFCLLWVANGFFYSINSMTYSVVMLRTSPADRIGSISATARSLGLAILIVGPVIGGLVATQLSIAGLLVACGGGGLVSGAILLSYATLRSKAGSQAETPARSWPGHRPP
jgi:MFS family permease